MLQKYALYIGAIAHMILAIDNPGTWSELASMPAARQEMPGVHLDGKIYVAGGMNSNTCCNDLNTFEAYDIASNKWAKLENMPYTANHLGMAALNGKVYVFGGWGSGGKQPQSKAFAYDVASKKWTTLASMPHMAAGPGVVVYKDKIYVFGGSDQRAFDKNGLKTVQEYDPAKNSWKVVNSAMPHGRCHIGAGLIGDKVYLSPGRPGNAGRATDNVVQEFDFATMNDGAAAWRVMKSLPENPRTGYMSSWPVVNGRLYYIGGEDDSWTAKKYHHEFTPDAGGGTWRRVTDYPITIHGIGPVAIGNKIYVCGGGKGGGVENKTSKVYVYTIKGVPTSASKPVAVNHRAARQINVPALIFNSRGALVSFTANALNRAENKGLRKGVYLIRSKGNAKAVVIE